MRKAESVIRQLLSSEEPSIRYKTRVSVLGESPRSAAVEACAREVRESKRVRTLLGRDSPARPNGKGVYAKWQGAHWALATLSDLGYPPGDEALFGLRDEILDAWLADEFFLEFEATGKSDAYGERGVPVIAGRFRRCASQQGYALYFLVKLGLADDRVHRLAERLMHWRWPDGGWNCDKEPSAKKSTFIHTLHCMRGLQLYGRSYGRRSALAAAEKASEIFLTRQLFRRVSDGRVMKQEFTKLHYPLYWHYDVLFGLKAMNELARLEDPRCSAALDLLEKKRLPDGGWPAEGRYYSVSQDIKLNADWVDWEAPVSSARTPG